MKNNDQNDNPDKNEEATMNEKKIIIDLVNKIKYTVTEEQMAELAGSAVPLTQAEFVDWHAKIDEMDMSGGPAWLNGEVKARLREALHRIADLIREVGGRMIPIGRRILRFVLEMVKRYPGTAKALVIMAALSFLVAHIPLLHYVLLPIVQVVGVLVVGLVFLNEHVRTTTAAGFQNL